MKSFQALVTALEDANLCSSAVSALGRDELNALAQLKVSESWGAFVILANKRDGSAFTTRRGDRAATVMAAAPLTEMMRPS